MDRVPFEGVEGPRVSIAGDDDFLKREENQWEVSPYEGIWETTEEGAEGAVEDEAPRMVVQEAN